MNIEDVQKFVDGDKLLSDIEYLEHHNFMLIKKIRQIKIHLKNFSVMMKSVYLFSYLNLINTQNKLMIEPNALKYENSNVKVNFTYKK